MQATKALQSETQNFLTNPSAQNLQNTQARWNEAFVVLESLTHFLHLGLQSPETLGQLMDSHKALLTWPATPGVLDQFGPYDYSGLVFDISVPINAQQLRQMHLQLGEEDVFIGLYPIHCLLFGLNNQKQFEAYEAILNLSAEQTEQGFTAAEELPNNRRRLLLQNLSAILLDDVGALQLAWQNAAIQNALRNISAKQFRAAQVNIWAKNIEALAELTSAPEENFGLGFEQMEQLVARVNLQAKSLLPILPYLELKDLTVGKTLTQNLIAITPQPETPDGEQAKALYQKLSQLAKFFQEAQN